MKGKLDFIKFIDVLITERHYKTKLYSVLEVLF